ESIRPYLRSAASRRRGSASPAARRASAYVRGESHGALVDARRRTGGPMAETRVASNGAFRLGSALLGVLLLVLGAAAFVAPFLAGVAANLAFGSVLVVAGVVRIVYAAKGGGAERVGISALLGLVSIVAGALLLFR